MQRKAYLTIDDMPSKHTKKVVHYLREKDMPALFYARGEYIALGHDGLREAIKEGFLIGNHSFHHPYFSELSFAQCVKEIAQTETILERSYQKLGLKRRAKIIRLPWSDRGAGPDLALPKTAEEQEKCEKLQDYLQREGFSRAKFAGFEDDNAIDAPYSWKTEDFKLSYVSDHRGFVANLENYYQQSIRKHEIILAHDFDRSFDLLRLTIDFLTQKKVEMLLPEFD